MSPPRLIVSSDLNGTLIHQHSMSDMIRLFCSGENFRIADAVFRKQTSGTATMQEAFGTAGPLTRGLTLRQAIEYVRTHMRFVSGFDEFIAFLRSHDVPLVVNSTGYSVTIYAIQAMLGDTAIQGHLGNILKFGKDGSPDCVLEEAELRQMVFDYFDPPAAYAQVYDRIQATGDVELGIVDESAKADLVARYVLKNFPSCGLCDVVHMGDTMGDSGGIAGVASSGGNGIAFNYNETLEAFLRTQSPDVLARIHFVDPKSRTADLRHVLPVLESLLAKEARDGL